MEKFNVYFWLRGRTIYSYIYFNGKKSTDFSTGLKCNPEQFDAKNQICKLHYIDRELDKIRNEIFRIKDNLDREKNTYTACSIKTSFFELTKEPEKLYRVIDLFLEYKKEKNLCKSTISSNTQKFNALKNYLKNLKCDSIYITNIDIEFIDRYKKFLISRNFSNIYINRNIQLIISLLSFAERNQYIKNNYLKSFEYLPKETKQKIYLTQTELNTFETYKYTSPALQRVQDLFLFQCYTGLDYSSMANFKENYIKQFQNQLYIEGERQKNNHKYMLPFNEKANVIFMKYGKSLPIISNQKYNAYLKQCCEIIGFEKQITTHSGRKTFANVMESKGIDRRTIADMLGHTKADMTLKHYSEVQIEGIFKRLAS